MLVFETAGGSVRLRVLGCSGTYPTANTPSSGYLIEHPTAKVQLDCGTGTFAALQRVIDYNAVDALVLTHVHSDHCLDLYPLYYARRFNPESTRLAVYCPEGTEEHLAQFLIGDGACKLGFIFDFRVVGEGDVVDVGEIKLSFMKTDHPIPTVAVRADAGGLSVTYSSDTGPAVDLHTFAAGTDVFLCEASYQNNDLGPPLHISAQQAGEFAKRAGVRDLVITHFWPGHDRGRSLEEAMAAAGDIPVHVARAGGVFDVEHGMWI